MFLQKSSNGVYVNNTKLLPYNGQMLADQDLIEIGRDPQNNSSAAYRFRFYKKAKVQVNSSKTRKYDSEVKKDESLSPETKKRKIQVFFKH